MCKEREFISTVYTGEMQVCSDSVMNSRENRTEIYNYKNVTNHIMHGVIRTDSSHQIIFCHSLHICFSNFYPHIKAQHN